GHGALSGLRQRLPARGLGRRRVIIRTAAGIVVAVIVAVVAAAGFGRFTRGRGVEGDLLLRALPILVHVPPVDLCGEGVALLCCGDHGDLRAGSNVAVHVVRDAVD